MKLSTAESKWLKAAVHRQGKSSIILIITHICLWPEKDPIWLWGIKGKCQTCSFEFDLFFCTETQPSFVIRWWYPHSCCQLHEDDLPVSPWSKILDGRSWSYFDIYFAPFQHLNATLITPRLMILPSLRQWLLADLHWFFGQNMTSKGQT